MSTDVSTSPNSGCRIWSVKLGISEVYLFAHLCSFIHCSSAGCGNSSTWNKFYRCVCKQEFLVGEIIQWIIDRKHMQKQKRSASQWISRAGTGCEGARRADSFKWWMLENHVTAQSFWTRTVSFDPPISVLCVFLEEKKLCRFFFFFFVHRRKQWFQVDEEFDTKVISHGLGPGLLTSSGGRKINWGGMSDGAEHEWGGGGGASAGSGEHTGQ